MNRNFFNKLIFTGLMLVGIDLCAMQQQQTDAHQFLYKKNTHHAHQHALDRLTQESYISPEMQWAVLSFLGAKEMVINKVTGAVENLPSVNHVLGEINKRMHNPGMTSEIKELMKNALHAMLEATDIAIFVAAVEAAYQDQKYIFKQTVNEQLSFALTQQKDTIQTAIKAVSELVTYDEQDTNSGSFFSWIPSFGFGASRQQQPMINSSETLPVPVHGHVIAIPARLMPTIIATNNYKTMTDANQAANFLFKECFIAQQHHLKDVHRIKQIAMNLKSPISQYNYIFTNFPNIEQIIAIAQQSVQGQMRLDVQAPVSPQQAHAHALLLHIRQSLQAALYIANNRSNFNLGYVLPSSVRSYLGGIVGELSKYDAQLDELCKNPQYGATQEDLYRSEQLWQITKLAAGTLGAAAVTGLAYVYGGPVGGAVANRVISVGQAVFNPEKDSAIAKFYNVGGKVVAGAAAVGTAATTVGNLADTIQWANEGGYIPDNLRDKQALDAVKIIGDASKNIAVATTLPSTVKGVFNKASLAKKAWDTDIAAAWNDAAGVYDNSWYLWKQANILKDTADAVNNAKDAAIKAKEDASKLYGRVKNAQNAGINAYESLKKLMGQETSQEYRHPQGSSEKIAKVLQQVIFDSLNQNLIATEQVKNAAYNLLQNKVAPMHVIQALQIIQQQAPSEDEFNQIGSIIQEIAAKANIKIPVAEIQSGNIISRQQPMNEQAMNYQQPIPLT